MELPAGVAYFVNQIKSLLLSPGSSFSLTSLFCALTIAVLFIVYRRRQKSRRIRVRTIFRALFPKRITRSASTYADLGYLYFNMFVNGLVFGWAVLSYQYLTNGLLAGLVAVFGPVTPSALPNWMVQSTITLVLFLAYEIGYWLNHWLSHRIPFMWEFHRVHHSAEVLTPLTNFRVHPVYIMIAANIVAIITAIASGFVHYAFGDTAQQYAWSDSNLIIVVFIHVYIHLQHSELWIPFRGLLGRIFVSPAHHQVHHSSNPAHFNRNYGSCLAVWDWMFGTLHVPTKAPEVTGFGVEPDQYPAHTITGELIAPFIRAAALFRRKPPADGLVLPGVEMPGLSVPEQKQQA